MGFVDNARSWGEAAAATDSVVRLSPGEALRQFAPRLEGSRKITAICAAAALLYLADAGN